MYNTKLKMDHMKLRIPENCNILIFTGAARSRETMVRECSGEKREAKSC